MLTDARFKFALECLQKSIMMEPKANFFFSPHLLYHNLLLAYFGSAHDLEDNLRRLLYIPDDIFKHNVEQYYKNGGINQFCYTDNGFEDSYTCRIYSRMIMEESKGLYVETINLFAAGNTVKEYDFNNRPDHMRNFVNNIITCTTQNGIHNLLPLGSIDNTTEIIMFNTIYCKSKFEASQNPENNIAKQATCKFGQLNVYTIEVPCKENKISTFFFFPPALDLEFKNKNNASDIEKVIGLIAQLRTEKGSRELRKLLDEGILTEKVDMVFPLFDIEQHDLPIYELLDMLGILDFTPDLCSAELDDFGSNSVKLGDVMHRVNIKLTKTDITASAANVFFTYNSCKHEQKVPKTVDVVFPCICLIYDRPHHNIFFCGVLWES